MLDQSEIQRCEEALRSIPGLYDWLLDSTETYMPVSAITEGHKTSVYTVRKWVEEKMIPGAYVDPATNQMRIPRIGLVLFFGRLVMPTFRAA